MGSSRLIAALGAASVVVAAAGALTVLTESRRVARQPDRLLASAAAVSPSPSPSPSSSSGEGALVCDGDVTMGFMADYDGTGQVESTPREALARFFEHTYRRAAEQPERFTERMNPARPDQTVFEYRDDTGQVRAEFTAVTRDGVSFIETGRLCQHTAQDLSR